MSVNKTTDVTERGAGGRGKARKDSVKHYYIICLLLKLKPTLPRNISKLPVPLPLSLRLVKFSFSFFFCVFQLVFWFYLTWLLVVLLLVLQAATLRRRLIATVGEGRARGRRGGHTWLCVH